MMPPGDDLKPPTANSAGETRHPDPGESKPIIVVMHEDGDFKPKTNTPRDPEPLCDVTPQMRTTFRNQVSAVSAAFSRSFSANPNVPAVAKVKLKPSALAKSRRPSDLFDDRSCPIIGANNAGEIYVSVTRQGLKTLDDRLQRTTKRVVSNISTLQEIAPYSARDAIQDASVEKSPELRVRLFRHNSPTVNRRLDDQFRAIAIENGVDELQALPYSDSIQVYRMAGASPQAVNAVGSFIGTQSVSAMPSYQLVRTAARVIGNASPNDFPQPVPNQQYAIVGQIDSGTGVGNIHLRGWIHARHSLHPDNFQDNEHGSFVAGLIANAKNMNHRDPRFPEDQAKIVDIVAIDKTGQLTEAQLLFAIDDAIRRYPNVRVWNLSLALVGAVCSDMSMSLLGLALDERRKKHGVLFVVPTGNLDSLPFRSWPPDASVGESDRMAPPGDAISSLTVGSIAHRDSTNSLVKTGEPSPFSRRGLGFGASLKPELTGPAGNADASGSCTQVGVISVNAAGFLAENIGVSFAVPQASAVAANVFRQLEAEPANPTLVKGLMVHTAFTKSKPLHHENVKYFGIGSIPSSAEVVNCRQSAATIVFNIPVTADPQYTKHDFPMPSCLMKNGLLNCEIFMTLIYDPPVAKGFGLEYCRTKVVASLGTDAEGESQAESLVEDEDGGEDYRRVLIPSPDKLRGHLQSDLAKLGYDWSPLKLYYRKCAANRTKVQEGKKWRLTLARTDRAENVSRDALDVTLIVTIRALEPGLAVHDELVSEMTKLSWRFRDLKIQPRIRLR